MAWRLSIAAFLLLRLGVPLAAEELAREGQGPYPQLIVRGVFVVDGTGAPAWGPADLVIRGRHLERVVNLGPPGAPPNPARRPVLEPGGREIDATGSYALPGFIDLYSHVGPRPEYERKLWLGHGITTVREPFCGTGFEACARLAADGALDAVTSPRYVPYAFFGIGRERPATTATEARQWIATAAAAGMAGVKFRNEGPEVLAAALEEARERGLGSSVQLDPLVSARVDALAAARLGATMLEHWYGLPEALLPPGAVQTFPPGYNHNDQQHRFAAAARLWLEAAPPGSARWQSVVRELARSGITLVPTLSLYEGLRDRARAEGAEWHQLYTTPELWDSFAPAWGRYATPWARWTSEDEAAWSAAFLRFMAFLRDFQQQGGRVATGSDSGFLYNLHGFGYVRELELLRQAGLSALEVVRAATLDAAIALGRGDELGSLEAGKLADLLLVAENPLDDLKVLYGTGALRLDADGRPVRVGGVRTTIKNGVVYDAPALLADVRRLVAEAKVLAGRPYLPPPGLEARATP